MVFWNNKKRYDYEEEEYDEEEEEEYEVLLAENIKLKKKLTSLESLVDMRTKEKLHAENQLATVQQNYLTVLDRLNHVKKNYSVLEREYRVSKEEEDTKSISREISGDSLKRITELEQEKLDLEKQLSHAKTELADIVLDARKTAHQVIEDAKREAVDYKELTGRSKEQALSGIEDVFIGLEIAREKMNRLIKEMESDINRLKMQ